MNSLILKNNKIVCEVKTIFCDLFLARNIIMIKSDISI